ncbi:MAG TPA: hypothetical protein VF698_05435 [Thermoanaerobaculia bacterium]
MKIEKEQAAKRGVRFFNFAFSIFNFRPKAKPGRTLANIRGERSLPMRIQETDRILKESRIARNNLHQSSEHGHPGMLTKAWQMISGLFKRS